MVKSPIKKIHSFGAAIAAMMTSLATSVTAYASGIKIDTSGHGITIQPGNMPDMTTSISTLQSAIDDAVMPQVRTIGTAVTSICTIICLIAFLISVTKLATSAGNPANRQRALTGILFSGIALALFGGAWIIVAFFWNFLAGI